jgi:hypothetical protein
VIKRKTIQVTMRSDSEDITAAPFCVSLSIGIGLGGNGRKKEEEEKKTGLLNN